MPSVSRGSGIFNGRSDLIKDLLDVVIITKQIRTMKHILTVVQSLTFHVNCVYHIITLFVINFIILCTVYVTAVCK